MAVTKGHPELREQRATACDKQHASDLAITPMSGKSMVGELEGGRWEECRKEGEEDVGDWDREGDG